MTAAVRSPARLIDSTSSRTCVRQVRALQDEARRAEHHAHLVVGLVRHAAGQPAHRLHLLHLAQMLLDPTPVGHILEGGHRRDDGPTRIPDRRSVHAEDRPAPIESNDLDLLAAHGFALEYGAGQGPFGIARRGGRPNAAQ